MFWFLFVISFCRFETRNVCIEEEKNVLKRPWNVKKKKIDKMLPFIE